MNQNLTDVIELINKVLIGKGGSAIPEITPNLSLRDDIGLDSLDLAELTVRIEDKFGVDIFENGIVETVNQILIQLDRK